MPETQEIQFTDYANHTLPHSQGLATEARINAARVLGARRALGAI